MASISHRTMYADTRNNRVRFLDFFSVQTTVGACLQPVPMKNFSTGHNNIDQDDEYLKVDKLHTGADLRAVETMWGNVRQGGVLSHRYYTYD